MMLSRCLLRTSEFVAITLLTVSIASADQNSQLLNPLFEQLSSAKDSEYARQIENKIWTVWSESDSDYINQRMSWGETAMREGSFQEALEIFTAITEKKPEFSEGWNKHATILYFMDRHEESMVSVLRTLDLEPRHFGALTGKGLILAYQEKLQLALLSFEAAKRIYPLHSRINQRISQMHLLIEVKAGMQKNKLSSN